jgi:hypothetical protein
MGSAAFPLEVALDQGAAMGPWHLEVAVRRTTIAEPPPSDPPPGIDPPYVDATTRLWLPLTVD